MIEDEVSLALARVFPQGGAPPVVWVESGLHDYPDALRRELQGLLDRLDAGVREGRSVILPSRRTVPGTGAERPEVVTEEVRVGPVEEAVLAFGYCGTGIRGLVGAGFSLVFPRVDDCISLLLNHGCLREEIARDPRAYYLTRGWLSRPGGVQKSFAEWAERYGEERAEQLRRMMYAGYERVSLIDTGAYDVGACRPHSREFAEELALDHEEVPGSLRLLEALFDGRRRSQDAGPRKTDGDNSGKTAGETLRGEIVTVPPGRPVSLLDLMAS